jgi:hypothetical protein
VRSSSFLCAGTAALLAAMAPVGSALAAENDRSVTMPWTIQPFSPPDATITAMPGDIVLKQKLLPFGLATLSENATDEKTGNLVAPAGTTLLRLKLTTGAAYCVAADPKKTALARAKPGSPFLRACFVDADLDHRFESSAEYDGKAIPLPSVSGRLPKKMHLLVKPVPYAERPVEEYDGGAFVGIRYDGVSGLSGEPVFMDVFGRGDAFDSFNRSWPRSGDGTGSLSKIGSVLLNGARLEVIENDGRMLKLKIVRSMPTGSAGATQRGSHFF